jgi:UDP-2,4-diacetamido-2,4,6-trideoxy-beta-L-altropyranose hydrolase
MVAEPLNVAFRADASHHTGAGHLMRCLTLADELRSAGATTRFVSRHLSDSFEEVVRSRQHTVLRLDTRHGTLPPSTEGDPARWLGVDPMTDADDTCAALHETSTDWLVTDHYAIDARWQRRTRAVAKRILAIDDLADRDLDCDLLLDQNFHPFMAMRYEGHLPPHCRGLFGPRFALLRPEFRAARVTDHAPAARDPRVLVFFGGVDAADYTSMAVDALTELQQEGIRVDADVVIGAGHARLDAIRDACSRHGFSLHVQTLRMPELMARADVGVGAGGSATWERCCVGLPSLVIAVADNQRELVRDAALEGLVSAPDVAHGDAQGLAMQLRALLGNSLLRASMRKRGRELVDGNGAARVLRAMGVTALRMRLATQADSSRRFEWRNHESVRAVSRSTAPIDRASHESWLAHVLADPERILLIGELDGQAVGVVRFDVRQERAEVSIYKVPGNTATGTGADLLLAAESWLRRERPAVRELIAEVLGENQQSHRLFAGAGYRKTNTRFVKNREANPGTSA